MNKPFAFDHPHISGAPKELYIYIPEHGHFGPFKDIKEIQKNFAHDLVQSALNHTDPNLKLE